MSAEATRSIATHFAAATQVDAYQLKTAINDGGTVSVTCTGVAVAGDAVTMTFAAALSEANVAALDAVVAAYAYVDPAATTVTVVTSQESVPTNKQFKCVNYAFEAAAGTTTNYVKTWKGYQSTCMSLTIAGRAGDSFSVYQGAGTTIGVTSAATAAGATTIAASAATCGYIVPGNDVRLVSGATASPYYEVRASGTTIALEEGATVDQAYAAGAYIQLRHVTVQDYVLVQDFKRFGDDTIQGAAVPPNTVATIAYTNNGASAVTVRVTMEIWR